MNYHREEHDSLELRLSSRRGGRMTHPHLTVRGSTEQVDLLPRRLLR